MLIAKDIELDYGRNILNGINFNLYQGQFIGIVGKSGVGKSSFLKILAGLIDPTSGKVYFEGKFVKGPSINLVPGHPEIQLVNQDFQLDLYHTVEENIKEQILYLPNDVRNLLINELLDVLELANYRDQKAFTLSGGEKQRLAIGRALAKEPKVLLLDEPFSHLDNRLRSRIIRYLLSLKKIRNLSIVIVSHDGSEVLSLSDHIFCMKKGRFVRGGTPHEMYYKNKNLEDAKLFGSINSINISGKRIYFRPDEYKLNSNEDFLNEVLVKVNFEQSVFNGMITENYFTTDRKERIVLHSFSPMSHVNVIQICKKK